MTAASGHKLEHDLLHSYMTQYYKRMNKIYFKERGTWPHQVGWPLRLDTMFKEE